MKNISLIIGVILAFAILLYGGESCDTHQMPDNKKEDIKELIIIDGQKEHTQMAFDDILRSLKDKATQIPPSVWEEIRAEIDTQELYNELIPIYDKYLTHAEIKELLGNKESFNSKDSKYYQKKLKINVLWGHKIAMKIQQKLWDRNINFDLYDELEEYDASCNE